MWNAACRCTNRHTELPMQSRLPSMLLLTCWGTRPGFWPASGISTRRDHVAISCLPKRAASHAHTLGFALWWGWVAHWLARSDPAGLLTWADELLALSVERKFAFLHAVALVHRGWSLAALGHANDGIPLLSEGLAGF